MDIRIFGFGLLALVCIAAGVLVIRKTFKQLNGAAKNANAGSAVIIVMIFGFGLIAIATGIIIRMLG